MSKSVVELAREARQTFRLEQRADGSEYWTRGDLEPVTGDSWLDELVYEAHRWGPRAGDVFLPDDYRYQVIVEALDLLAESEVELDPFAFADDVDVHTSDLYRWLSSNVLRSGYVDDAVEQGLVASLESGLVDRALRAGQYAERLEVFESVVSTLERLAEQDGGAA